MVNTKGSDDEKGLSLKPVCEGLRIGVKSDGVSYSVREDRSRYFWPEEWFQFISLVKEKKRAIFEVAIGTGGRIDELLHIKPKDFDWDRNNLTLRVTKRKAAKKEKVGKPRTFSISSQLARKMRAHIKQNNIRDDELMFKVSSQAVYQLMKRVLKKMVDKNNKQIDWWNFSLHNIRKTHGNYLKAMEVDSGEICYRLGHDLNTFIKHYGSANIFDRRDKLGMIKILGDVYGFK